MFIALEGIDGSGKTTQALLLAGKLRAAGGDVLHTCEPSQSEIGKLIRTAIKPAMEQYFREALPLLFFADRMYHLDNEIKPALAAGQTVVCDRYYLSTFVYQSLEAYTAGATATIAGEMDAWKRFYARLAWLHDLARHCPAPTLTIVLHVPLELAKHRLTQRGIALDHFEHTGTLAHIAELYQTAATLLPAGVKVVHLDGEGAPDEVSQRVLRAVLENT